MTKTSPKTTSTDEGSRVVQRIKSPFGFSRTRGNAGFTLVEVMVVLGILAGVLAMGLPRVNKRQNNFKKVMREMGTLGKEIRDQARLKNMTFRLVFRIGDKKDAYWVEGAAGPVPARSIAKMKDLSEDERKTLEAKSSFQKAEKFIKGEKKLPEGMKFVSVATQTDPEPIKEGMAYVYFSPEGLVEKSVIQIGNDKDNTWTLIYNPITGHADIIDKAVDLKDATSQL